MACIHAAEEQQPEGDHRDHHDAGDGEQHAGVLHRRRALGCDRVAHPAHGPHEGHEEDHQQRRELYNLYHLLNHANLFGGSYTAQAQAVIRELLANPPI